MNNLKILHVSKLYLPFLGGIETVVKDLVEEQRKSDAVEQVDILAFSENNETFFESHFDSKIIKCSTLFKFASVYISLSFFFYWFKIRNNYDIVHVHFPNPLASLAISLLPTKAKVIVHWHSDIVKQKYLKQLVLPFQRRVLNICDVIIVTSEPYLLGSNDLQDFYDKVKVVPIGIESPIVEDVISKDVDWFPGKKVVFSLGRHVPYKGFHHLIDAAESLPNDYLVVIGGSGPLTSQLIEMVDNKGLDGRVLIVGRIPSDELTYYFKRSDVFVLPSVDKAEAFGVVQLEAMSFGLPIVSARIEGSGVPWVNKQGVTGEIFEVGNSIDLADKIMQTVNEHYDKKTIIEHFKQNFLRSVMASKVFSIYRQSRKDS